MELPRTRFAYETIEQSLSRLPSDPLIENFFVQYLLVCFYSEVEAIFSRIIQNRLSGIGDARVATFVLATSAGMLKRVKKTDINDVLRKFGCEEPDLIGEELNGVSLQPYHDAIANRHLVAHGDGCQMTLSDFKKSVECAEAIFDAVEQAIAA